jgi:hypothetical protein
MADDFQDDPDALSLAALAVLGQMSSGYLSPADVSCCVMADS